MAPTTDADTLLIDARLARQAGDLDTAIALFEDAYTLDPDNAVIRVELSATYFERDDLDLFDLDRVALFLMDQQDNATSTNPEAAQAKGGGSCSYADDPTAVAFDPRAMDGYPELIADRATVDQVLALLDLIIPDELRALSLCSGIDNGMLVYAHADALAYMRGFGLSDNQIASALAINAVARLLKAYFFLADDLAPQTQWYRLADGSIGVCADDLDAIRTQSEDAIADLGEAMTSLDLRDRTLGGGTLTSEILDNAIDAYEAIADDLGPYCSTAP